MTRTVNIDFSTNAKKFETALNRFFKKYPELEHDAKEQFEYMYSEGIEHQDNGTYGEEYDWTWSVWFYQTEDNFYFAWIERE